MKRPFKIGLSVCGAVVLAGTLSLCAQFTRHVTFSLSSHAEQTILDLYVAKVGFYLNPHGGGRSDHYGFVFTRGLSHIRADEITEYFANGTSEPHGFLESGGIDLKFDGAGCEVSVRLFTKDGQALPFNGMHRVRYCGQQYL